MHRLRPLWLVPLLLGVLAWNAWASPAPAPPRTGTDRTGTNRTETNRTEISLPKALTAGIGSITSDQIVEFLSQEENEEEEEEEWWRTVDIRNATIADVLDLWNIGHDELHERSRLCGNASAEHIHAYLQTQKLLENSTCGQVTYQMLNHGRLLRADWASAQEYARYTAT